MRYLKKLIGFSLLAIMTACIGPSFRGDPENLRATSPVPMQAALHLPRHPVVVIVADPAGTETTDFLLPHAILTASGAAEVIATAPDAGEVALMPALTLRGLPPFADFQAQHPEGADIVIVPALHNPRSPAVLDFLRGQAAKGALMVSVCEGAEVLARAGLLEGYHATSHFYALPRLARAFPGTVWTRNIRYLRDRDRITSAGVSASIPLSLYLVSLIDSAEAADRLASRLGVADWSARHDQAFAMDAGLKAQAAANLLAFWGHETLALPLRDGFDEAVAALQADAWSRSWRSTVLAGGSGEVRSAQGLRFVTRDVSGPVIPLLTTPPGQTLPATLQAISARYGAATARFVQMQLELPAAAP